MEHMDDIERFFHELMRVSPRGYLASPSALKEMLFWWPFHKYYIALQNNTLFCCKKRDEKPLFGVLFHYLWKTNRHFRKLLKSLPRHVFDVEYYWEQKINYVITDSPILPDLSDEITIEQFMRIIEKDNIDKTLRHLITRYCPDLLVDGMKVVLGYVRKVKYRKKDIDLNEVLVCPMCKNDLTIELEWYERRFCRKRSPIINGIPNFVVSNESSGRS